jgi:hypothetical protein
VRLQQVCQFGRALFPPERPSDFGEMVTIEFQSLAPRLAVAALLGWNSFLVLGLTRTCIGVAILVQAQSYLLRALCRVVLGPVNAMDAEALGVDVSPFSRTLWVTILGTHTSGFAFAPRHLLLLAIQRLLRVPMVCATLWPSMKVVSRLRLTAMALLVSVAALLACTYWMSDPFGDHPSHPVLLADGLCALTTAVFELGFLFWIAAAHALGRSLPERFDSAVLFIRFIEAVVHLLATLNAMTGANGVSSMTTAALSARSTTAGNGSGGTSGSGGVDLATAPPVHVQLLMLKRLWLAANAYSQLRRSQSLLNGIPEVPSEGLARDCAICLEQLTLGSRQLPCGHSFHARCLHRWLMTSPACPLCRRRFSFGVRTEADADIAAPPRPARPDQPLRQQQAASPLRPPRGTPAAADAHMPLPPQPAGMHHHHHDHPSSSDDDADIMFTVPNPWPFGIGAAAPPPPRARRDLLDDVFGSPVVPDAPGAAFPAATAATAQHRPAQRQRPPVPWQTTPASTTPPPPSSYQSPVADILAQSSVLRRELAAGLQRAGGRQRRPRREREEAAAAAAADTAPSVSAKDFASAKAPATQASLAKHARRE